MPDKPGIHAAAGPPPLVLHIPGEPGAVRAALRQILGTPALAGLGAEGRGTVELVLAEVLNNIVEHAYGAGGGTIEIVLRPGPAGLDCRIADAGGPMPGGALPPGLPPDLTPGGDLPEGGFGWHLIRSLTTGLAYRREGGRNLISFHLIL